MRVRPTIRVRLTLLYGGLFFGASVVLIAVLYLLLSRALAPNPPEPDSINQQVGDQTSVDKPRHDMGCVCGQHRGPARRVS